MRTIAVEQRQQFGTAIRSLREAKGLGLRQFARAIPIAPSYQSFIESGAVPPPSDAVLVRMAELLDVSEQALFIRAGRLPPAILHAFWQHPAVPPVLSTIPGMTLEDAQTFCRQVLASMPQSTPA
jgi:HTH-type transcriptional regulator, competence development regulator